MNLIKFFLAVLEKLGWDVFLILIVGLLMSSFYYLYGPEIIFEMGSCRRNEQWHWRLHHRLLYFLGSFVGWLVVLLVLTKLKATNFIVDIGDIVLILVAVVGITGYLPKAIERFDEFIGKTLR